jgi:hypothetical protein
MQIMNLSGGGGGGHHGGGGHSHHGGGGHGHHGGGHHSGGGHRGGGSGYYRGGGYAPSYVVVEPAYDDDYTRRTLAYIMTLPKGQRLAAYVKLFGAAPPAGMLDGLGRRRVKQRAELVSRVRSAVRG